MKNLKMVVPYPRRFWSTRLALQSTLKAKSYLSVQLLRFLELRVMKTTVTLFQSRAWNSAKNRENLVMNTQSMELQSRMAVRIDLMKSKIRVTWLNLIQKSSRTWPQVWLNHRIMWFRPQRLAEPSRTWFWIVKTNLLCSLRQSKFNLTAIASFKNGSGLQETMKAQPMCGALRTYSLGRYPNTWSARVLEIVKPF